MPAVLTPSTPSRGTLDQSSDAPAVYDVALYDLATFDDNVGRLAQLSVQTSTRATLTPA